MDFLSARPAIPKISKLQIPNGARKFDDSPVYCCSRPNETTLGIVSFSRQSGVRYEGAYREQYTGLNSVMPVIGPVTLRKRFPEKSLQRRQCAASGDFVVHHTGIAIVGTAHPEDVHSLTVRVDLPVSFRCGKFLGQGD
jgi:hypothetical protein